MKLSAQLLLSLCLRRVLNPPRPVPSPQLVKRRLRTCLSLVPADREVIFQYDYFLIYFNFFHEYQYDLTSSSTEAVKIVTLTRIKSSSQSMGGDAPSTISSSEDLVRSTALSSGGLSYLSRQDD
jgi:hypothetical protein